MKGDPQDLSWAELNDAWVAWDSKPGDPGVAGRMEGACWVVANYLGITTIRLRDAISRGRREGRPRSEVLQRIREEYA